MADINYCEACETLKEVDANLVVNGFTDENCANLQENTGLAGDSDDCTDLNTMNDCLIGAEVDEAEITEVCNWREYMGGLVQNIWTMNKALICTICGLWDKVVELIERVTEVEKLAERTDCIVDYISQGIEFEIGEEETDNSYVVAGKGVSFLSTGGGQRESEVSLTYIAGGLMQIVGSLKFYDSDFTDEDVCYNYDLGGADPRHTTSRKGNSVWNNTTGTTVPMAGGGELLFEIRLKKSAYPQIDELFAGSAFPTGGGAYHVNVTFFDEGEEAYGQSGSSDTKHTVPDGWIYIQARMVSINYLHASGNRYSPRGYMGIRFNHDEIVC